MKRKLEYQNTGANTYYVYTFGENEKMDSTGRGMLTNNKIPGFVDSIFSQNDEIKTIKYNVSGKLSAADIFSRMINKEIFVGFLEGFLDAISSCNEYMLDYNNMLLDLECIFFDYGSWKAKFIYVPVETDEKSDIIGFLRQTLFSAQIDTNERSDYFVSTINFLNKVNTFTFSEFKNFVDSLDDSKKKNPPQSMPNPAV